MLLLGSLASFAFAVAPLRVGKDVRLRVPAATAVALPSGGLFGTTLLLYGRAGGERPGDQALGCDVTNQSGDDMGRKVFTLAALGAEDRTVDGTALQALATVDEFDGGWLLTCSGPAAISAQPLYLLGEERRPIPRPVIASFGLVCLALGAGGLALARRDAGRAQRPLTGG